MPQLPEPPLGCTAGVIQVPGGILFFKNRDLQGEFHRNQITVYQSTPDFYALRGVNLKNGELEGVSIGVNRRRVCVANTHILSTEDVTYDVLCERLLVETRERKDVNDIVKAFLQRHAVQGGRILVSSPDWNCLVEVLARQYRIQEIDTDFVITNTFSLLPHPDTEPAVRRQSSTKRLEVARDMIKETSSIRRLKSMLRSHTPEKGELSICNHRRDGGGTESSHIIQIQGEYVGWSSLQGFPCENDYHIRQLF